MSKITKKDSEQIAKKYKKDGVILLHFDFKSRKFGYASYGKDKEICKMMKFVANQVYEKILAGDICLK